ncbi:conserved hypothetical protein [Candidatus Terasakiella magnetica]|uniref:VTC domain-containing protein n=1 Tax=Candidatus Terasakiella magnetica TaxID=1867952 RepID=A0A1C3RGA8_9PROT|nr:polyphosphate polymerase domain-containing protein [Candidatus Terasakiella magnetica]SCA56232.1 conserved hypothetical protein [Candidatus Terasakiella magnetica]
MDSLLRFESKYLISQVDYYRIRADIRTLCTLDKHSKGMENNRYFVRSLYYDSYDLNAYVQKVTGENIRNKLRIRTYSSIENECEFLKIEQKMRIGRLINKIKTTIPLDDYQVFVKTGSWPEKSNEMLRDFERIVRAEQLRPVVLVDYDREAWFSRFGDGVRISFDHDVRYASSSSLFGLTHNFKKDLSKNVVMEIKCEQDDVAWVSELVRLHGLKAEPNSKYVNAIDNAYQQVWH